MSMDSFLDGKSILLVEDNTINQMLVKYTLSASGAMVDICDTGSKALEKLHHKRYDFILMDIHMPELDGFQTTEIIRNELKLDTPILAMTALSIGIEEEKCFRVGMNGSVSKPFTIDILNTALAKWVYRQRSPE
ncbi:MAG: multi-sensor hybrid histidine kinase [Chitinophagaceae bacterium]|nr:multi-sensor hybrid histidine kinase [Chitinophagaceae bacterium]